MKTVKEIKKVIKIGRKKFEHDVNLIKLQDFLKQAKRMGLLKKQDYNIPPVDTLGKKLLDSVKVKNYQGK